MGLNSLPNGNISLSHEPSGSAAVGSAHVGKSASLRSSASMFADGAERPSADVAAQRRNSRGSLGSMFSRNSRDSKDLNTMKGVATGKPFPRRPLTSKLSSTAWSKIEELFNKMDGDCTNAVTREQARNFFKGAYAHFSVEAMFNEVDVDGSGAITPEEFVDFWTHVRSAGYKDEDIIEEVMQLMDGQAWVDWKDGTSPTTATRKRFPKRPFFSKVSSKTWKKCEQFFRMLDIEARGAISFANAEYFFEGGFRKVSAEAMFNSVDIRNHGMITAEEWMSFWVQVRGSGYKDKDIQDEIDNMMETKATWVDWKDTRIA